MKKIGRLHVLTDTVLQDRFSHPHLADLAISGGADTIQYRQKSGSTKALIETAAAMRRVCAEKGATFIVNDRIDVAIAVEADGVHLGQDDFPIGLARKLLGEGPIIGASAATLQEIETCIREGADYVGFGPIYPTGSKDDAGTVTGIDFLRQITASTEVPVIAIGGIAQENAAHVMAAGAYGIAVISSVCCQEIPEMQPGIFEMWFPKAGLNRKTSPAEKALLFSLTISSPCKRSLTEPAFLMVFTDQPKAPRFCASCIICSALVAGGTRT
jgi:thiamine-phosphate pyrophosphorylase